MTKYYYAPDGSVVQDSENGYEYYTPGGSVIKEFPTAGGGPSWDNTINEIASPGAVNEITNANIQSVNEI